MLTCHQLALDTNKQGLSHNLDLGGAYKWDNVSLDEENNKAKLSSGLSLL